MTQVLRTAKPAFWALVTWVFLLDTNVAAAPTAATVESATHSVFHVLSTRCRAAGRGVMDHLATGFAVSVDGSVRLVTALHAVAGCSEVEIQYRDHPYLTSVDKVYRATDLALLTIPAGLSIPAMALSGIMPSPGAELEAIGYHSTPSVNPSRVPVRLGGATDIAGLIQGSELISLLRMQGFPSLSETIINIDGTLTPGDSGAPLIDDTGAVVGVANGNLFRGTMPISWAFPATSIRALLSSQDAKPNAVAISDVLVAEEVPPRGQQNVLASSPRSGEITCGARAFQFRGTQTLARLLKTADPFAKMHIGFVRQFAMANQMAIDEQTRFDVYVDSASGADFVIPNGFRLSVAGRDCVATDPENDLQMRISTDAVTDFYQTTNFASSFGQRMLRGNEGAQLNPQYSTAPVPRVDGMQIQRVAVVYVASDQAPPLNEGYITLAWRRDTLIESSVRTLTPAPALRGNQHVFPAVTAVYAASFQF